MMVGYNSSGRVVANGGEDVEPEKGNCRSGKKNSYMRQLGKGNNVFSASVLHSDTYVLEAMNGTSMGEFEEFFSVVAPELAKPMNVRQKFSRNEQQNRSNGKRMLEPRLMLFLTERNVCWRRGK